jgi:hypothetical protein
VVSDLYPSHTPRISFANAFDKSRTGKIFAFTAGDGIADREDGDTHGW